MRDLYVQEIALLNEELIEMGDMIEKAIEKAVKALTNKDIALAKEIIQEDVQINSKQKAIEHHCLTLFLRQQPIASDLRLVSAAIKIITDMERIGDHAADISEITVNLSENKYRSYLDKIPEISAATIKILKDSIAAFVSCDVELAHDVQAYDDVVDNLFVEIKNNLIGLIRTNANASEQAVDLIMIAKYFERIADHAVNISDWVEFSLTGNYRDTRII